MGEIHTHAKRLNFHKSSIVIALHQITGLLELRLKLRLKRIVIGLADHCV